MNSIILNLSFWIKICPFFVCSYVATICVTVLNPLFVDVRMIASSSTLLYFDMGTSPESSRTRLFQPLLLNLNLSDFSLQSLSLIFPQAVLLFSWIQSYKFSSASAKSSESLFISNPSNLSTSQNLSSCSIASTLSALHIAV